VCYHVIGTRVASDVLTNKDAANTRVVLVPVGAASPSQLRTVITERASVIGGVIAAGGRLVVERVVDALSRLEVWTFDGTKTGEIASRGPVTLSAFRGRDDSPVIHYGFASCLTPASTYRHDLRTGTSEVFFQPATAFDASPYESRHVFYTSKDGTRVPMIITSRKNLPLDGRNPTMPYPYGGFNIGVQPSFSPAVAARLEMGGVYAVPNLYGGSEYGEAWHQAGMLDRKQNVVHDFIAAGEHLQRAGITSPGKLARSGGSNGGLLLGAPMTQRPDLAAVALPGVGVLDMLRYDAFSAGKFWVVEYRSAKDPRAYTRLRACSPLHNVKPGVCHPATVAYTADHDDRAVPSHTDKFTATLQAVPGCSRPVLTRIQPQRSHGNRPTDQQIAEREDLWAFTAAQHL
jgi:prolyl oligopeptidase